MKTLLFKTPKGDAYLKLHGEMRRLVLDIVKKNTHFDCVKVKMEGGGFRLKFTCLTDDLSLRGNKDIFVLYFDKGSIIYDF